MDRGGLQDAAAELNGTIIWQSPKSPSSQAACLLEFPGNAAVIIGVRATNVHTWNNMADKYKDHTLVDHVLLA